MPEPIRHETPRRTKIVATIGPASWDPPVLEELLRAGVDVCRVNCSHCEHDDIRRQVATIRAAAAAVGKPVAILLDLQGPKIRTGDVATPLDLAVGDTLTIVMTEELVGEGNRVGTTYPEMADDVEPGIEVLFDDGSLGGIVREVRRNLDPAEVIIEMTIGGQLKSHKGINLPGVKMSVPSLTDKDRGDLVVGVEQAVDYVALSFVRGPWDVVELRSEMRKLGTNLPIIAKIEKPEAVQHLDGILKVSEGVMVARGDLGVEVKLERVPVLQKEIIERGFRAGALVITATQMLDSMIENPRPTRAETTDVANAILDGTDAVMLSGETATGAHPIAAVRTMDRIAREAEQSRFFVRPALGDDFPAPPGAAGTLLRAACFAVTEVQRPLVVFTWSGASAAIASKARPPGPIYALTGNPRVVARMALVWGVTAVEIPSVNSADQLIAAGERALLDRGWVSRGEELVILAGRSPVKRTTYLMKIMEAGTD